MYEKSIDAFYARNVRKLDRAVSGRLAIVEANEPAQAFPAYDRPGPVEVGGRQDELAAQALMVVLADRGASMAFAELSPEGRAC
jgi:hypothetical protein